ncbi:MAG: excinuclease ABC subunit UvrC [Alphaproteobacteria bacterium]
MNNQASPPHNAGSRLSKGTAIIREFAKTLPISPGVYRMLSEEGQILYVGKARQLQRRVMSYTQTNRLPNRLRRMVSETCSMEWTATASDVEALLLEIRLIKHLKPRYNVLLRDDKSFPFIWIGDGDFPQIGKHRGKREKPGDYFGPFASAGAVESSLYTISRSFGLRSCHDSEFAKRQRPCLQYHIKRCTAPCVQYITQDDYKERVKQTRAVLKGQSMAVQQQLASQMQEAAEALDYEKAAHLRDRLRALSTIQASQIVHIEGIEHADIVAAISEGSTSCVQLVFYRHGQHYGNRSFFLRHTADTPMGEILASFIMQFYEGMPPPPLILLSHAVPHAHLIEEALKQDTKIQLHVPQRGERKKLVEHALNNAAMEMKRQQAEKTTQRGLMQQLGELLGMDTPPQRVEIYDNSHLQGAQPVGVMVVAGPEGFLRQAYRKYNMSSKNNDTRNNDARNNDARNNDDYAMMQEMLMRRFTRALQQAPLNTEIENTEETTPENTSLWPDVVLIDGGLGQLSVAKKVKEALGFTHVKLVAVAKGPNRNAGEEVIYLEDGSTLDLTRDSPVLYFIQRLRDEAHRFAIGTHRQKRQKNMTSSSLDDIPAIGPKRKKALLNYFGSGRAVRQASLEDLQKADGISQQLAKQIYDFYHPTS